MKLVIYKENMKDVEKVVESEATRIPLGIVRKFTGVIDGVDLDNTAAATSVICSCMEEVEKLLLLFFPELEEKDLDHIDVVDVVEVFRDVFIALIAKVKNIPTKN